MIAVPLSLGDWYRENLVKGLWAFSALECVVMVSLIWSVGIMEGRLDGQTGNGWWIRPLIIFGSIASMIKYCCIPMIDIDYNRTKERSGLNELIYQKKYADALELIAFKEGVSSMDPAAIYVESLCLYLLCIVSVHCSKGDGDYGVSLLSMAMASGNERAAAMLAEKGWDIVDNEVLYSLFLWE